MESGVKVCMKECGKATQQDSHSPDPGRNYRMVYFKACKKCFGDLASEQNSYGAFLKFLQSGNFTEVSEVNGRQPVLHGAATNETALQTADIPKTQTP